MLSRDSNSSSNEKGSKSEKEETEEQESAKVNLQVSGFVTVGVWLLWSTWMSPWHFSFGEVAGSTGVNPDSMTWSQPLGVVSFTSRDHLFCLDLRADHGGAHAGEQRDDLFVVPQQGRYPALIFQRDLRRIRSGATGFHRDVWTNRTSSYYKKAKKGKNGTDTDGDGGSDGEKAEEEEEKAAEDAAMAVANDRFKGGTGR